MRSLLFIVCLLAASSVFPADRTLWLFEQLSVLPPTTAQGVGRSGVQVNAVNYVDSFSYQGQANLDIGWVEFLGKFGRRQYLSTTDKGAVTEQTTQNKISDYSVEVARYFAAKGRQTGRFGLGYFSFMPGTESGLKLSLSTGILPSPEVPWQLGLQAELFFMLKQADKWFVIRSEILKRVEGWDSILFGGFFSWSYRPAEVTAVGSYEYMLLSLGPSLALEQKWGRVRLDAGFRIWLDRQVDRSGAFLLHSHPNEFSGVPDLAFSGAFLF